MIGKQEQQANIRYQSICLKGITPEKTDEGFYIFRDVKVARTGMFDWACIELACDGIKEHFPELSDGDIVSLQRDSISEEAIRSLDMKPITNGHPKSGLVNPRNSKEHNVGSVSDGSYMDGEWLYAKSIIVYDESALADLDSGKVELSIGYTYQTPVEFVKDLPYVAKEVIIYINHVAIVHRGRAGNECRFNEELSELMNQDEILKLLGKVDMGMQAVTNRVNSLDKSIKNILKNDEARKNEHVSPDLIEQKEIKEIQDSERGNSGSESTTEIDGGEAGSQGSKPEEKPGTEAERKNQGENPMNFKEMLGTIDLNEALDAVAEKFKEARGNDMFYTTKLNMRQLLNQVATNGLIGIKNGKGFDSKEHTRANDSALIELIDEELACRADKVEMEGARSNSAATSNDFNIYDQMAI